MDSSEQRHHRTIASVACAGDGHCSAVGDGGTVLTTTTRAGVGMTWRRGPRSSTALRATRQPSVLLRPVTQRKTSSTRDGRQSVAGHGTDRGAGGN